MPVLQGKAKDLYLKTYGQALYVSFTDRDGLYHGGVVSDEHQESFLHRPRHDVESVFWTLFYSLLRVSPQDALEKTTPREFSVALNTLDSHALDRRKLDSRGLLLTWRKHTLEAALHPKLAPLAPMLELMCRQILPEYAYLSPSPRKDHLHEAMRRLLLQQIVDMGSDTIPLDPHAVRVPIVDGERRIFKRVIETIDVLGRPSNNKKMRKGTHICRIHLRLIAADTTFQSKQRYQAGVFGSYMGLV